MRLIFNQSPPVHPFSESRGVPLVLHTVCNTKGTHSSGSSSSSSSSSSSRTVLPLSNIGLKVLAWISKWFDYYISLYIISLKQVFLESFLSSQYFQGSPWDSKTVSLSSPVCLAQTSPRFLKWRWLETFDGPKYFNKQITALHYFHLFCLFFSLNILD